MTTYNQEIKERLEKGEQFSNDVGGWITINKPSEGLRMIMFEDENKFYKNMKSYAIAVVRLLNRGY